MNSSNGTSKKIIVALLIILIPAVIGAVLANTLRVTATEVRMDNVCEQLKEIKAQNREILSEIATVKEKVYEKR